MDEATSKSPGETNLRSFSEKRPATAKPASKSTSPAPKKSRSSSGTAAAAPASVPPAPGVLNGVPAAASGAFVTASAITPAFAAGPFLSASAPGSFPRGLSIFDELVRSAPGLAPGTALLPPPSLHALGGAPSAAMGAPTKAHWNPTILATASAHRSAPGAGAAAAPAAAKAAAGTAAGAAAAARAASSSGATTSKAAAPGAAKAQQPKAKAAQPSKGGAGAPQPMYFLDQSEEEIVEELVKMGTDEELARRAVRESGGDGEKAQLWLFSHQEKAERQKQGPAAAAGAAGGKAQAAGGAPQPTAAQLAEEAYRREQERRHNKEMDDVREISLLQADQDRQQALERRRQEAKTDPFKAFADSCFLAVLKEMNVAKAPLLAVGAIEPLINLLEQEEKAGRWFGVAPRHYFRRVAGEAAEHVRKGSPLGPRLQSLFDELKTGMAQMPPPGGGPPAIFAGDIAAAAGPLTDIVVLSDDD